MDIHFPYSENKGLTGDSILNKVLLLLCVLGVFSLPVVAQSGDYIYNVPSLLMKDKPYTFSIKKSDNGALPPVLWSFGDGADPSSSSQPFVEVTYSTAGVKTVKLTVDGSTTIDRTIYVSEAPDNIEEIDCYIEPETTNWQPQLKFTSPEEQGDDKVHILAQPFVGDIDGDGVSEVVATNRTLTGSYTYSNKILIFDQELKRKKSISTPQMYSNSAFPLVLVRLNPTDKEALIIIATADTTVGYKLRAYKPDGTVVWTSTQEIFSTGSTSEKNASVSLVVGDINNDGTPDILAGDRIFNARTGALVSTLPAGGRGYRLLNSGNPTYMPLLADMDNDGQLEVVTGNTIYKVTNTNGSFKTTGTVLSKISQGDGFVSVADIDMDGQLDVVSIIGSIATASKPKLVVWTLEKGSTNGKIIAGPIEPVNQNGLTSAGVGGSRVFIGNVDDDIYPELFYSYGYRLVRFDYNKDGTTPATRLNQKWLVETSDQSGATTLSMFDFDQDGKAELVYRDMSKLRIIDGDTGADRQSFACFSATHSEYPVVVDFDRDGHADILVSGAVTGMTNSDVRLYWFSGDKDAWAPARTVWNQHGYNAVNVNEDLTIPKYQLNPSTAFAGKDKLIGTSDDVYPYNSFLQQQTSISGDGVPFFNAPRVEFPNKEVTYDYDADSDVLTVENIKVTNTGDAIFTGPLHVTVYKNKVHPDSVIHKYNRPGDIAKGQTVTTEFTVNNFSKWLPVTELVIRVNDAGDGKTFHRVCDDTDAESSTDAFLYIPLDKLAWADNYRKCEGGEVTFRSDKKMHDENVKIEWWAPGAARKFSGDTLVTRSPLQLNDAGKYLFQANIKEQLHIKVTLPYLSVAPTVMYWRADAQDGNWNNLDNWAKSAVSGDNISAVPGPCTKVYLPAGAANYPSLGRNVTDWSLYGQPEVDKIVFRYGSELYYQHLLKYNKAYVNYNWGYYGSNPASGEQPGQSLENGTKLKRDVWHILAAPLKKMASGDFSLAGHPFSWQKQFQVTNVGGVTEGDFSVSFPTNDIPLVDNNNAIAVKMVSYKNENGYRQDYLQGLDGVIEIPYFENKGGTSLYPAHNYDALAKKSYFYYFDTKSLRIMNSPVGTMSRADEAYRFIYEDDQGEAPGENYEVQLNTEKIGSTGEVMLGNPFLAPIYARVFAAANTGKIDASKGYKLLNDDGTWVQKSFNDYNEIPAWKAFVITLQGNPSGLSFPIPEELANREVSGAGAYALRASLDSDWQGDGLSVRMLKGGALSGDIAQLQYNRYTGNPDIAKMILPDGHQTPEVFFISSDGKSSNLIQQYPAGEKEIAIGVKTSDVNSRLSLEFGNIAAFSASTGASVALVDKRQNIKQDLTLNPVYSFTQQSSALDNQYVDRNRFVLQLGGDAGTMEPEDTGSGVDISYRSGILQVTLDEHIDKVWVYDLYGRLLFSSPSINQPRYSHAVVLEGKVFLVRVKTVSGKEKVKKIMSN